jgi:hypothetical protein
MPQRAPEGSFRREVQVTPEVACISVFKPPPEHLVISFPRASRFLGAALALALAACGDPAAPEPTTEQDIDITNVFATSPSSGATLSRANFAAVEISRIRLTVYRTPGDEVLFQEVFTVDPTQSKWTLKFTAPIGATVRITAELISVTGGQEKVEYSGQASATINECEVNCEPIPIQTYPGPIENLAVTGVTLSPDAATVLVGSTVNLTATVAAPAGTSYEVVWRSLNEAAATVASGVVTGVASGTAQITASAGTRADTVTVTVTAPNTCTEIAYTIGSTANGAWADGDCVASSGSGRRFDMYAVTLAQQAAFTVALTGPAGRRISVRRAGTEDYVQVMASEAFMPAASNPLKVGYILPAGSYVMEVANPDAATLGAYSLATTVGAPAGCDVVTFVWPSVTVSGSIASTDCASPVGTGREDRYILLPNAGTRLAMSVATTAFAPLVLFRDDRQGPASPTLAYDMQTEIGETAKLAYTTTFAGFTEVIVSHMNAGGTGNYTLTLGTESATNTCVAIDSDLARKMAVWETTDCTADSRLYDKYTFTTDEQTAFKVTLASTATSKSAGVFRNGVEILDWSRTAAGDLTAAWVLEPGTYEFRAGAPAASAGATYTIVASDISDVGCTNNGASGNVELPGQSLGGSDCTFNGSYEDRVVLFLAAGKTLEVNMTGTTVAPRAVIRDPGTPAGTTLVNQTRTDNGAVTATYTTTVAGYYQVIFTTNAQGASGAYSASIVVK